MIISLNSRTSSSRIQRGREYSCVSKGRSSCSFLSTGISPFQGKEERISCIMWYSVSELGSFHTTISFIEKW